LSILSLFRYPAGVDTSRTVFLEGARVRRRIENTLSRIAPYVRRTPCRRTTDLSRQVGADVHLKLENLQTTGSFKLRGVLSKVLSLDAEASNRLLVAASTGNHGMAFAHVIDVFGLRGKLFIPNTASRVKVDLLHGSGIPFEAVGDNCVEAETFARRFARDGGHVWISPYNDIEVVRGQGTVAVEILEQIGMLDTVLVPVGGGGLISGIAGYLRSVDPTVTVIGCQPRNSCIMYQSVRAGAIVEAEEQPTLADGTAGGIEPGALTFEMCSELVDDFILVEESDIERAICWLSEAEDLAVEGAGALAVAALMAAERRFNNRKVVAVLSGSRIDPGILERLGCGRSPKEEA
jgi:threonine dehydratase